VCKCSCANNLYGWLQCHCLNKSLELDTMPSWTTSRRNHNMGWHHNCKQVTSVQCNLEKAASNPWGKSGPPSPCYVPSIPRTLHPKEDLNLLSCVCTAKPHDKQRHPCYRNTNRNIWSRYSESISDQEFLRYCPDRQWVSEQRFNVPLDTL